MMIDYRHSIKWMSGMLLLLLMACSHQDGGDETQSTMLRLYVYAPERPVQTRVDKGEVNAKEAENTIHQLQIWVFRHKDGELVRYFSPESTAHLNEGERQEVYLLDVPEWLGDEKPNVDVYVLANATAANCGYAFNERTTRDQLDAAVLNGNFFGLSSLMTSVPTDGLPMSGVLMNQKISGKNPVLHIGTETQVATVKLARAVSKVQFVFSRSNAEGVLPVTIDDIVLDAEMIPDVEYLFLDEPYNQRNYRVGTTYNATVAHILDASFLIAANEDPTSYVYTTQEAQEYETLIAKGVNEEKLTPKGPYYLHETDKKLSGVIKYHFGGDTDSPKEAKFALKTVGDFSRNHTWIVYAFCGAATLEVITVNIQDWIVIRNEVSHHIYNW